MTKTYSLLTMAVGCWILWQAPTSQAQEPNASITWEWTSLIDISEGGTSCEDGQLIPTSDGNCAGIYTTGGQGDIYEGRIVKLDMSGNLIWQQKIQAITSTTANRVAEGPNGTLYVAGTTLDGAVTKTYVTSFDKDGNSGEVQVLPEGNEKIMMGNLSVLSDGVALQYSARNNSTYAGSYYCIYFDFELQQKVSSSYAASSVSLPVNVVANDLAVVVVLAGGPYTDGQLITFPNDGSNQPKTYSGNYQAGYADTEDFYFVKKNSSDYSVERCAYQNGYFNIKWNTAIDFDTNYYSPVVKACEDGNVYLWHKSNDVHRIAKLSAEDGSVAWKKYLDIVDTSICEGFAYTLGVAENGDFVAGGHSGDFKVYWYRLASNDGSYVSSMAELVNDDFAYAYTYDEMSSFENDTFYFCGFLRQYDYNAGHTPFFVAYDIDTPDQHLWATLPECGYVPCDYPGNGAIAPDGSVYVAATISNSPALVKYDADGSLLFCQKCGDGITGQGRYVNIGQDGAITLIGTCETESYSSTLTLITSFNSDGEVISSTTLPNDVVYPSLIYATWKNDGTAIVVTSAFDSSWVKEILVESISLDGSYNSYSLYTPGNINPYAAKLDQNDCILVFGYNYDENSANHPCVMKINADGSLAYETSLDAMGELYGAWSDSEGRTYVVGGTNDAYAYYALLAQDGSVIEEVTTTEFGYYENVEGDGDTPILVGTVIPEGSSNIVGRVMALTPGTCSPAWTTDINSSARQTYALQLSVRKNAYLVAGYEAGSSEVAGMLAIINKEGELLDKNIGETIPNPNDDYYISALVANDDQALVLSARSVANLIYLGYASKYSYTASSDFIQSVQYGDTVILTEYYDLQGRKINDNYRGLCIRKQIMNNGSIRTQKVVK